MVLQVRGQREDPDADVGGAGTPRSAPARLPPGTARDWRYALRVLHETEAADTVTVDAAYSDQPQRGYHLAPLDS
jgi:hypothetical protein